jgi:WD repeat-containing protein 68
MNANRMPTYPATELLGHVSPINSIGWAPHSSNHICTCGDDRQALIWDITADKGRARVIEDPILAFNAEGEINQMQWDASHEDWIAINFSDTLQVLKV